MWWWNKWRKSPTSFAVTSFTRCADMHPRKSVSYCLLVCVWCVRACVCYQSGGVLCIATPCMSACKESSQQQSTSSQNQTDGFAMRSRHATSRGSRLLIFRQSTDIGHRAWSAISRTWPRNLEWWRAHRYAIVLEECLCVEPRKTGELP